MLSNYKDEELEAKASYYLGQLHAGVTRNEDEVNAYTKNDDEAYAYFSKTAAKVAQAKLKGLFLEDTDMHRSTLSETKRIREKKWLSLDGKWSGSPKASVKNARENL